VFAARTFPQLRSTIPSAGLRRVAMGLLRKVSCPFLCPICFFSVTVSWLFSLFFSVVPLNDFMTSPPQHRLTLSVSVSEFYWVILSLFFNWRGRWVIFDNIVYGWLWWRHGGVDCAYSDGWRGRGKGKGREGRRGELGARHRGPN